MLRKLSLLTVALLIISTAASFAVSAAVAPAIGYNYTTDRFTGITTGMEYAAGTTASSWTAVTSLGMIGSPGTTYWFRFSGEADSNQWTKVEISSSGGAPTGFRYTNSRIIREVGGVAASLAGYEYNFISDKHTSWTKCTGSEIRVTLQSTAQKCYIRLAATAGNPASAVVEVAIPASTTSNLDGITRDYEREVFSGFGANGGDWYWTSVSAAYTGSFLYKVEANEMKMLPDMVYYFRKSSDTVAVSTETSKRPAAPTGVGYLNGELTGATSAMRYRFDGTSTWFDCANGIDIPQKNVWQTVYVANKSTADGFASLNTTVRIWPNLGLDPAVGESTAFRNVRYDGGDGGAILGVTSAMEYQIGAADGAWKDCPNDKLVIPRTSESQDVYIRLKADGGTPASGAVKVVVKLVLPKPEIELDIMSGIITGLDPNLGYAYRTAATGSWKIADGLVNSENKSEMNISTLLKGQAITFQLAIRPASGLPEDISTASIAIAAPPVVKPSFTVASYTSVGAELGYVNINTNAPVIADLQYKLDNDPEWSNVTSMTFEVGYTASVYVFRIAPKQSGEAYTQGSAEIKVKVGAPVKAPNIKVDYKKEIIKLKANMLYSIDGDVWQATGGTAKELSLVGDDLYGSTVMIRTAPTDKKPASDITVVSINPRLPYAPTGDDVFIAMVKNKETVIMRSGARQIEHRLPISGSKWKKGVPKYAAVGSGGVEIRFMATNNNGPSETVKLYQDGVK